MLSCEGQKETQPTETLEFRWSAKLTKVSQLTTVSLFRVWEKVNGVPSRLMPSPLLRADLEPRGLPVRLGSQDTSKPFRYWEKPGAPKGKSKLQLGASIPSADGSTESEEEDDAGTSSHTRCKKMNNGGYASIDRS
uniref:Uncharacterized protein n=1 Tax=Ananas comosus var. bracteatus TaxID=296719 RepID=A0A6V7QQE2_ANACO|nr:unnamed protein product [Ananas comosus var. bracteatus]